MVPAAQSVETGELWRDPDRLADLLDGLRKQGYKIGPNQYAMSQDVVLALIARGEDTGQSETLKLYLGPILCSSPREQANFSQHFDRWARRDTESATDEQKKEPTRLLAHAGRRWRTWWWILAVAGVLGAAALVLLRRHYASSPPIGGGQPIPPVGPESSAVAGAKSVHPAIGVLVESFAAVAFTAIGWAVWWYYRARLFLSREASHQQPELVSVALDPLFDDLLEQRVMARTARELRRRYAVESDELNPAATVDATSRRLGEFTPVQCVRYVSPEYLVLIDRRHLRDENAQYIDEMIARLARNQVYMERFYFDRDPRMLYPLAKNGRPISLRTAAATYKEHRVLLFTDAAALFDPVTGELARWADSLWSFHHFALFTPRPIETWGYHEHTIAQKARVFPARPEALLRFGQQINGGRISRMGSEEVSSPFPSELASRPVYWLSREAPAADEIESILASVRRYLGAEGFFWLCACAVYPGLKFNLTVYLGSNLKDGAGGPLFTLERLSRLLRLPWFQYGYMPDWLRLELVKTLSKQRNKDIREALNRLWLSVSAGSDKPIELEIARRYPLAMKLMAAFVFRTVTRRAAADSPLQDYVFASVMLGRNVEPLAVRIPRVWRKVLNDRADERANATKDSRLHRVVRAVSFLAAILSSVGMIVAAVVAPKFQNDDISAYLLFAQLWSGLLVLALGAGWLDRKVTLIGIVFSAGFGWPLAVAIVLEEVGKLRLLEGNGLIFVVEGFFFLATALTLLVPLHQRPEPGLAWGFKVVRYMFAVVFSCYIAAPLIPIAQWGKSPWVQFEICFLAGLSSVAGYIGAFMKSRPLILHCCAGSVFVCGSSVLLLANTSRTFGIVLTLIWALGAAGLSLWVLWRLRPPVAPAELAVSPDNASVSS